MSTHPHEHTPRQVRRRLRPLLALAAIAVAAVVLAACGSSSSGSSTTTASSSTSASAAPGAGAGGGRFTALRSCLQKEGINLPAPKGKPAQPGAGGGAGAGGGRPGGFLKAPEGVSQAKFEEALKKCGGGSLPGRGSKSAATSATARAALTKYAACMRENGVNLPAPNTSGSGPVFNTSSINTTSTTFKNAQAKCQSDLAGAFGSGGGSSNAAPAA